MHKDVCLTVHIYILISLEEHYKYMLLFLYLKRLVVASFPGDQKLDSGNKARSEAHQAKTHSGQKLIG